MTALNEIQVTLVSLCPSLGTSTPSRQAALMIMVLTFGHFPAHTSATSAMSLYDPTDPTWSELAPVVGGRTSSFCSGSDNRLLRMSVHSVDQIRLLG
jgi:hypothetical protein